VPKSPSVTAPIVEWKRDKRYGFLQVGTERVFLHQRNFARQHKVPEVGDVLRFTVAKDGLGRPFASKAVHVSDAFDWRNDSVRRTSGRGGKITLWPLVFLAGLLILPAIAVRRIPVDSLWIQLHVLAVSALTFFVYGQDKKRARGGGWRVSEFTLHFLEAIGGWPGAFLAQRWFRHKISKLSYQIAFWLIVLVYQLAGIDFLLGGRLSQGAAAGIQRVVSGWK